MLLFYGLIIICFAMGTANAQFAASFAAGAIFCLWQHLTPQITRFPRKALFLNDLFSPAIPSTSFSADRRLSTPRARFAHR